MKLKLEKKQIGVFTAILIGLFMLLLPGQDKKRYTFKPELLAKTISQAKDQVRPEELSQWIIEGKNDFQLIDIRTKKEFDSGHIKKAQNIPLDKLLKRETIEQKLSDSKIIILYSNGNSHAHQAWLVLKTSGVDCYVLEGGYNYWNKVILNPAGPKNFSDDEILKYKGRVSVAKYFGGSTGKGNVNQMKKGPVKKRVFKKRKKKKLEGC
ncbi:rhodanese-like domain-containing protein [Spirochaetota bacterium]